MSNRRGTMLLITGLNSSGKTKLLEDLRPKETLVIATDGKEFPYKIPHVTINSFGSVAQLLNGSPAVMSDDGSKELKPEFKGVVDAIVKFKSSMGKLPKVVVIDTVSRILERINSNCLATFTGDDEMKAYAEITRQVNTFVTFVKERIVAKGIDVILTSHVTQDPKTAIFTDSSCGKFKRNGGILSVINESLYIEAHNGTRQIFTRDLIKPARTLLGEDIIESVIPSSEFNLQDHMDLLANKQGDVSKFDMFKD